MKPRTPTPDERRLWRESNRFTQRAADTVDAQDDPLPAAEAAPVAPPAAAVKTPPAPARRTSPPTPLALLPAREAAKQFKSHAEVAATLDLHGMGKIEAYAAVAHFVSRHHRLGHRHVAIITGKGRPEEGVLKRELPHWLNEPTLRPLIAAMGHARPEKGGAGVMHVLLKKA